MKKLLFFIAFLLLLAKADAQRHTEVKLDLVGPLYRSMSIAAERHLNPKFGIQGSLIYTWDRLTIDTTSTGGLSLPDNPGLLFFSRQIFQVSSSARYYPWGGKEGSINAFIGPIMRIALITRVDPEYYSQHRILLGREAFDPYTNYPDVSAGFMVGLKEKIKERWIFELSLESLVSLTQWFGVADRSRRSINIDGYFRILIGYKL